MTPAILIIQENGRRERNRDFRECHCLRRAFNKLGIACEVWGPGHPNAGVPFEQVVSGYNCVLSLENYNTGWHPDLSRLKQTKLFWCIDAHMGVEGYLRFARQHRFDVVFNSCLGFVDHFKSVAGQSTWLPNALDPTLIDRLPDVPKNTFVGFCGNAVNRGEWIAYLKKRWNLRHDEMVIGPDMVRAINGYQIHWNRNISVDINFRTFETLGCGTLLLTNPTPGLDQLFELDRDLLVYDTVGQLEEKLAFCKAHPEKVQEMARRGYDKVRAMHTYEHRAQAILECLQGRQAVSSPDQTTPVVNMTSASGATNDITNEQLLSRLIQAFERQDYQHAGEAGIELMRRQCRVAIEPVFCLAGAAFRKGDKTLALSLVEALLAWIPSLSYAVELRQKLLGNDMYRTTDNPVVPLVQVRAYEHFAAHCQGASVVEVGCGTGLGTKIMAAAGAKVHATDLEATCLEYGRSHYGAAVEYRQCSGTDLSFADKSMDFAVCVDVIEHIADFHRAIAEMCRVARKGVFIATPNQLPQNTNPDGTPKNYWHLFEWTPEQIVDVMRQHFEVFELGFICGTDPQLRYEDDFPMDGTPIQALVVKGWLEKPAEKTSAPAILTPSRKARRMHLVYAGDPRNDRAIKAPETITNHLFRFFEKRLPVVYHDWLDQDAVEVRPDDLILGHPHYHASTALQRLFAAGPCVARCLIFPFHHAIPRINEPFTPLVRQADKLFSITGEYWHRTLPYSALAEWGSKMTRVDMALDASRIPHLKRRFNPPGQRVLFYIGSDLPEKGVNHLAHLVRNTGCKLVYAGSLNQNRAEFEGLNMEYWGNVALEGATLERIVDTCDFFVNTSVSDANPTTILEMAALGLPVLCTPQSGYIRSDLVLNLSLEDDALNMALVNSLQNASEQELLARTQTARGIVEREYTWDRFCQTVAQGIEEYL